ncbi:unnamed protein product, partial [marine sediment metagenome]
LASSARDSLTESVSLVENQTVVINATETADTIVEVTSKSNLDMLISIAEYSENLKNTSPAKTPLDKYVDIMVDNTINDNITKVKVVIYYNKSEVNNANIDESTLKIYYYNETSGNWQSLNSSVNTTAGYVWAELSHFSTYGVFGEQKEDAPAESSSSSGGSFGGGGNVWTIPTKKTQEVEEEVVKEPEIAEEEKQCSYSLSVELPEKVSFVETDTVSGVIKNDGDCDLDKVSLSLHKELTDLV